MEAIETTNDSWLLSRVFNTLGLNNLPDLQSAFRSALDAVDEPLDRVFEAGESIFRALGNEELANQLKNMQNGNWLARQFGLEDGGIDVAPIGDNTEMAETAQNSSTDRHFRM